MKKSLILLALILVVGATFDTASAQSRKKRKKPANTEVTDQTPVQKPIVSRSDSISYSGGMSTTLGLTQYLLQLGVDTAFIGDFVRGFNEYVATSNDPKFKAYAAGFNIASQVQGRMLPDLQRQFANTRDSIEADVFYRGFIDGVRQDTTVFKSVEGAGAFFRVSMAEDVEERTERLYGPNREAGRAFLARNAQDTSVVVLPSGLQYKVIKAGTGSIPKATEAVKVHYEGRLIDGTVFDSSRRHGDNPATFRPNAVIKGWTEALTMMPEGSKWQLFIPYDLAYGDQEHGLIKPFSTLVFDVELVAIDRPAPVTTTTTTPATTVKKTVKKPAAPKTKKKKTRKK